MQEYKLKQLKEQFKGNSKGLRSKLKEIERKEFREKRKQARSRKRMDW